MIMMRGIWFCLALAVIWGMAFSVSCLLGVGQPWDGGAGSRQSIAEMILGESRSALSGGFYEMADVYFHKGVGDIERRAFDNGLFQNIQKEITPERVVHASGSSIKEIMPWLWLAIRTNPHDMNAYLVTAYLLSREVGRSDLAHEVLREAQYNNPFNYEAPLEDARVYLKEKKTREAEHALDVALAFWPGGKDPNSPEHREDKATILSYRGLLYEADGDKIHAIEDYREILELFPDRILFQNRIESLERGDQPSVLARETWRDKLLKEDQSGETRHNSRHKDHHVPERL